MTEIMRKCAKVGFIGLRKYGLRDYAKVGFLGFLGTASVSAMATFVGDPTFYSNVLMPLSQNLIEAEQAHKFAIWAGKNNLLFAPKIDKVDEKILTTKVFDMTFKNPIGLAAGFDKDAEVIMNFIFDTFFVKNINMFRYHNQIKYNRSLNTRIYKTD